MSIFSTENISIWLKEAKNPYAAKWANWICDILNKCKFQGSPNFEKILDKENIGSEISIIVENNLRTSGLFNPISKEAFLQARYVWRL